MTIVDSFIKHIEGQRRYSPHTVANYRRDIDALREFLGMEELDARAVAADDIREWIISLAERGLKPSSVNKMLSSVSSLFRYLEREGVVDKNPMRRITFLKTPSVLPAYIPETKMAALVGKIDAEAASKHTFVETRDALIILLLYSTGIRLAELVGIDRTDFARDYRQLTVLGKGDKERVVPIVEFLRDKIIDYLRVIKVENICNSGEKALFLSEKGSRISRAEVYRIVRSRLTMMGVTGKRSPHVLRHTFATHLMNNGADMREIQELLGHSSLRATQVYTHNSIAELREAYAAAHPRSQGKKDK